MAKSVTMIPALKRRGNNITKEEKAKLKVAAYCRVSTDSDEQATSYDMQVEHYTKYIQKNEDWEFAGIYADDGISGTNTKKRDEFNLMIEDCYAGKIDLIVTKSVSRFARNTVDCLNYIRDLKSKHIAIFFEKENINTLEASGEFLITIMASIAQQESESLSQNVKLGLQFRYQNGDISVNHNRFMGYTKNEEGKLIIKDDEAEIVRRIYREYLEGASLKDICLSLEADGILTGAGKTHWRPETVKKMLCNEKYIGDALLQKTYTIIPITKERVKNKGDVPQYYVENNHEAIIPKDLYMQVKEEMIRRAHMKAGNKRRVYSSKYALSSMVFCSKCGDIYRRIAWNNRGKHSTVWRCCTRVEHGPDACDAETIQEADLQAVTVKALNLIYKAKDSMKEACAENFKKLLETENVDVAAFDERLVEIETKLLKKAHSKEEYDDLVEEIYNVREEKQKALVAAADKQGVLKRIEEMQSYLDGVSTEITEYDEALVRAYFDKITVYDDYFEVTFKSGISVDIEK